MLEFLKEENGGHKLMQCTCSHVMYMYETIRQNNVHDCMKKHLIRYDLCHIQRKH